MMMLSVTLTFAHMNPERFAGMHAQFYIPIKAPSTHVATVKVEILGSVIFSVNGKRYRSVRYYVLWTIRRAFIRMHTRRPCTSV